MRIPRSILGLALVLAPLARAQEARRPDAALTQLGLEAEKTRYVFADAEKELREKYRDATAARDQAREALAKVEAGAMMEQGLLEMQAGEQQLQAEIAATRSAGGGMGYGRGRYSRYYRNQADAAVRANQREAEQIRKQIARARKQAPTEKQRQAAETGARLAMDQARRAVQDVNDAYDALVERYNEVRGKPGVQKALEDAGRPKKLSYQLGPSEESDKIGKWAKGILKIRPKRTTPARKPAASTPGPQAAPAGPKAGKADTPR